MADAKLTDLTAVTAIASGDVAYIVDVSDTTDAASGTSKKVTIDNLFTDRTITTAILAGGTVVNEAGADVDFRVESDTDANAIFVEGSNGKVGFGTATPAEKLNVIGNFQVDDADTATKGYRFRTSGSDLDLDGSAASLLLSMYSGADFTGTQRVYMKFFASQNTGQMFLPWEIQKSGGTTVIEWNPDVGAGGDLWVFNQAGDDKDVRFEGDTDTDLIHVDASTDRVGIGVAAPAAKLDVNGDINTTATGNIQAGGADPKRGMYVPATAMFPSTTAGCAAIAQVESTTNDVNIKVLDFDGAGTAKESAEFGIQSPSWWNASTVTVQFVWYATAGSGTVNWEAQGVAFSDDDALDAAYGTLQEVTDTLLATGDVHITAETAAITIAGSPVAGDWVNFRINRDPANDTNTSDARLMGVRIRWTMAQYNDA